jgi:hypothetical protein
VFGTEAVRRGWRIRPHKVRLRVGRPLSFPQVEQPSASLAAAVTERVWACVSLQWEWLGGTPAQRAEDPKAECTPGDRAAPAGPATAEPAAHAGEAAHTRETAREGAREEVRAA